MTAHRHTTTRPPRRAPPPPGLVVCGADDVSPLIVLHLAKAAKGERDRPAAEALVQRLADVCLQSGVMLAVPRYSCLERTKPPPSLQLCATSDMEEKEVALVVAALRKAAKEVL